MKPFYIFAFLFMISLSAYAQNETDLERCGTDERHAILMQDPAFAAQQTEKEAKVIKYLKDHAGAPKAGCTETLYLPVAVHFQDVGIDLACAVEMALSQVEVLNNDFAGTNADITKWQEGKPLLWPQITNKKSCIVFCLASINHPAGTGVNEGDYAVTLNQYPDNTENIPEWAGYINMFVRNMTNPLGFSPLNGNGNGDGVTCGISYFGTVNCGGNTLNTQYNLGRTTTHEMGHYLGLAHPFGNDCATDNDDFDDTPITDAPTYGCPNVGEELINCVDPILFPTYMEYCNDACLYMFTKEQAESMDAYVNVGLQNLLNSATITCAEIACLDFAVSKQTTRESCAGNDGKITLMAGGGLQPYQYSINGGQTFSPNGTFTNLKKDAYPIIVRDGAGCEFIDTIKVRRESPKMDLASSKNAFCGDNSGNFTVKVQSNATFEYQITGKTGWQDTAYFGNLVHGNYDVVARTESGCESSLRVVVGDDSDLSFIINAIKPVNCPLFDNGLIDLGVSGAEGEVEWTMNYQYRSDKGRYEDLSPGTYFVEVADERGCRKKGEFKIGVSYLDVSDDCPCDMFIPNAMTPDGDGLNDLLVIVPTCPISDFTIQIFDRWGKMIFESHDIENKWNGGIDDYYVEPGIFFYRIAYRWGDKNNQSLEVQLKNGFVTVLR